MANYQDVSLSEDIESQLGKILSLYQGKGQEVIPLLQEVQEQLGYLPKNAIKEISKFLKIPESKIYGVVTFYAQFSFVKPGKNTIKICLGTACHVRGGERILNTIERLLGIKPGETTTDYEYTLHRVACIGCCALAPCMVINDDVYAKLTSQKIEKIFKKKG